MKIHYGIYDTHLNEWVTQALELNPSQLIQARQTVSRMNRAHDLLPDEYKISTYGAVRYKLIAKVQPN
jgi:hypothetical protein